MHSITPAVSPKVHRACRCAGCPTGRNESAKGAAAEWQTPSLPSAVTVPVTSAITSVTAHPDTDEIVAGTEAGRLLLLSNR